jgi:hypothetical protein
MDEKNGTMTISMKQTCRWTVLVFWADHESYA